MEMTRPETSATIEVCVRGATVPWELILMFMSTLVTVNVCTGITRSAVGVLGGCGLKGNPGPGGGFFKNQAHGFADQGPVLDPLFMPFFELPGTG
jgi:hypothetical protein